MTPGEKVGLPQSLSGCWVLGGVGHVAHRAQNPESQTLSHKARGLWGPYCWDQLSRPFPPCPHCLTGSSSHQLELP